MTWYGTSKPYEHQTVGLQELHDNRKWLLAWEMGLGKSAVIANRLRHAHDNDEFHGPTLILCPKSVVIDVWPEQLALHGGITKRITIIQGAGSSRKKIYDRIYNDTHNRIVIINYDLFLNDKLIIEQLKFDVIVFDEIHRLKSLTTKTSRAVRRLIRKNNVRYRWGLSGTPFPNNCMDVCGILSVLDPTILGTERVGALKARYAIVNPMQPGWIMGNNPNTAPELANHVASISSRILKEDALDLPPKIYENRSCTLPPAWRRTYNDLRNDAVARLSSLKSNGILTATNVLTESLRLLQCAGGYLPDDDGNIYRSNPNAKIDTLRDILEDIKRPCIIWTSFVIEAEEVFALLNTMKRTAVLHHGKRSDKDRAAALEEFKSGGCQFFISTTASAREGITLTVADTVIYYSRNWNLLNWLQSQDRAHRIGQTRPVTILSLVAEDTIDIRVAKALHNKITLQESMLQGSRIEDLI